MKHHAISKGLKQKVAKLTLHKDEAFMRREDFNIHEHKNRGKKIHMMHDKRPIINLNCAYEDVVKVNTLLLDILILLCLTQSINF